MNKFTKSNEKAYSFYICPQSHSKLTLIESFLRCETCHHQYNIINDVPVFLYGEPVEDKKTSEDLIRLNQIAREKNWNDALIDIFGQESEMYNYVTNIDRANFLDLLNLKKESEVLEIGPGLGQFSTLIAERVKHLYAYEVVQGQAEFASERCRQMGINNVQFACGGDDCRLPYPDNSMDTVIMNLVFEWCSTRNPMEPANLGQKRFLKEIFRVLRPEGNLYLSTKNRFALYYILGKRDEHSFNMRFGNALPRWLHNLLLKMLGHQKSQGLLHSHNNLQRMLAEAGFTKTKSYWATPEMRFPKYYIPNDTSSIKKARSRINFPQGNTRIVKLLMPLIPASIVKHFTPGLTFIAFKP